MEKNVICGPIGVEAVLYVAGDVVWYRRALSC